MDFPKIGVIDPVLLKCNVLVARKGDILHLGSREVKSCDPNLSQNVDNLTTL